MSPVCGVTHVVGLTAPFGADSTGGLLSIADGVRRHVLGVLELIHAMVSTTVVARAASTATQSPRSSGRDEAAHAAGLIITAKSACTARAAGSPQRGRTGEPASE